MRVHAPRECPETVSRRGRSTQDEDEISRPNCRGDPEWMKNALATKCDDQQAITEVTDAYGNVTEIKAKKTRDLGVLKCCGAFTSFKRLVSIRRGRGWSVF